MHDAYGEILDCAYQWVSADGDLDALLWDHLRTLVEQARVNWNQPDHGIWEVRTATRPFTYSAAMCQVALERGALLAERLGLPGHEGAFLLCSFWLVDNLAAQGRLDEAMELYESLVRSCRPGSAPGED